MKAFSRTFIVTLLFPFFLSAQESYSLEEAINYALENNSAIRTSQLGIADADALIQENTAIGLPKIKAGLNYTNYIEIPSSVAVASTFDPTAPEDLLVKLQFGTTHSISGLIEMDWLAVDGSYFLGLRAARKYRELTGENYSTTQQMVRNDVIQAYLPALIIAANLETLEKNIENLKDLLNGTRETYKAGFAEQLDVDRLELSLANLNVEQENLNRQTGTALNYLKFTMGYPVDKEIRVSDDINTLLKEANNDELRGAINFAKRPEYQAIEKSIELNELNVKRFKAMYYPSLRIFSSYQHTWQGNDLNNTLNFPGFFVGGGINVPLFDGFQRKAQIQRAQIDLELAKIQKSDLERGISLEVQNARIDYSNAQGRVQTQKRTVDLAQKIYNTTQIKYKEGVGTSLELTTAEYELYEAQRNHNQALYDLLVSKANLDKALGN